jgi:hypothetical protein
MDQQIRPLERAFQLAKSGHVSDVKEIRILLRQEGYSAAQVQGRQLSSQLRSLIADAHDARASRSYAAIAAVGRKAGGD